MNTSTDHLRRLGATFFYHFKEEAPWLVGWCLQFGWIWKRRKSSGRSHVVKRTRLRAADTWKTAFISDFTGLQNNTAGHPSTVERLRKIANTVIFTILPTKIKVCNEMHSVSIAGRTLHLIKISLLLLVTNRNVQKNRKQGDSWVQTSCSEMSCTVSVYLGLLCTSQPVYTTWICFSHCYQTCHSFYAHSQEKASFL